MLVILLLEKTSRPPTGNSWIRTKKVQQRNLPIVLSFVPMFMVVFTPLVFTFLLVIFIVLVLSSSLLLLWEED